LTKLIGSASLTSSGVPDDLLTTKGDTHGFSSINARIPVGSNNQVLTADSAQALGVKWATASGGAWTDIGSDSLTSADTQLEVASFTAMDLLDVYYRIQSVDEAEPLLRVNDDSGSSDYITRKLKGTGEVDTTTSGIALGQSSANVMITEGHCLIFAPDSDANYTGQCMTFNGHNVNTSAGTPQTSNVFLGGCNNDSTDPITSIQLLMSSGDCLGHLKVTGFDY